MNDVDAKRQIDQMVAFIMQEAKEKADELEAKTKEEYDTIRNSTIAKEEIKLKELEDKRKKEIDVKRKIKTSALINKLRLQRMEARDLACNEAKKLARARLFEADKSKGYPALVQALIVQGLIRLMENGTVIVRCRAKDQKLVEGLLKSAEAQYIKTMKDQAGLDEKVTLRLDDKNLPPPPAADDDGAQSCTGGIILFAHDNQILVDNTFEARLEHTFNKLKPEIRNTLFGARPLPGNRAKAIQEAKEHEAKLAHMGMEKHH